MGLHLGAKGALVEDPQLGRAHLALDDLAEVDEGLGAPDDGLLGGAEDGEVDLPRLGQDGELRADILVQLRQELELDVAGDARRDAALGDERHLEVVPDLLRQGQHVERVERIRHVGQSQC